MAISNDINFYLYNHRSKLGIEDFVKIYTDIFTSHGFNVINSSKLETNNINIIIEEFTSPHILKEIIDFKKEKKGLIYVIPTEFITKLPGKLKTFNFFSKSFLSGITLNIIFIISLIIYKFFYYPKFTPMFTSFYRNSKSFYRNSKLRIRIPILKKLRIRIPTQKKLRIRIPILKKLRIRIIIPVINLIKLVRINLLKVLFSKAKPLKESYKFLAFRRLCYHFQRYYTFNKASKYFDGFIHIHKEIKVSYEAEYPNIKSFIINPIIDIDKFKENFAKKKYGFYMTGTITKYRNERFDLLKMKVLSKQNKENTLFWIGSFKENLQSKKEFYQFSYNPGQSKDWVYSSPTRLYRSINENGSIPIIDLRNFDSDIEGLAIVFNSKIVKSTNEYYIDSKKFMSYIHKMNKYNNASFKINTVLCKHLKRSSVDT